MNNPYLLPNPSVISFSGGRTSGYMLRKVLDAFGGVLPSWVRVIFCNTGKEREETLEFVQKIEKRWRVPIVWLEYRWEPREHSFERVKFKTASRDGEPFDFVIKSRKMLPNKVMRFCTIEMKIRTSLRYTRDVLGWENYTNAIGFRHDEPKRVAKLLGKSKGLMQYSVLFADWNEVVAEVLNREKPCCPLSDAKIDKATVMNFWKTNDFDLALEDGEGNCDLCFLKGAKLLVELIRRKPESADWWIERERERELSEKAQKTRKRKYALFDASKPDYAEMKRIALGVIDGPGWLWADNANGSCGELDECRCTD